jgi:TolA-binding protein
MKKIITLFIAAAAVLSVNAQTSKDEARKVILGQEKGSSSTSRNDRDVILGGGNETNYPDSYPNNYPDGSRNAQVNQVNREYDAKIRSIQNNRTLTQAEKDRMIRQLEQDRNRRIRQIQNGDYAYGKKGKDHNKTNNGKHLGWEKGKGNPHKNGGKPGKG